MGRPRMCGHHVIAHTDGHHPHHERPQDGAIITILTTRPVKVYQDGLPGTA